MANNQLNPFVSGVRLGTHSTRKLHKHLTRPSHQESSAKYVATNTGHESILNKIINSAENQNKTEIQINRKYMSSLIKVVYFIIQHRWTVDSVEDFMTIIHELGNKDVVDFKSP